MRRLVIIVLGTALTAAAVQSLPAAAAAPPDAPEITSPAANTSVDGSVSLSATTGTGTTVEFTISDNAGNSSTLPADVAGGMATTDFESYGWSGAVALSARACNADGCGPSTNGPAGLTVANTDLVIDEPASDVEIGPEDDASTTLRAHGVGGYLRLRCRGPGDAVRGRRRGIGRHAPPRHDGSVAGPGHQVQR